MNTDTLKKLDDRIKLLDLSFRTSADKIESNVNKIESNVNTLTGVVRPMNNVSTNLSSSKSTVNANVVEDSIGKQKQQQSRKKSSTKNSAENNNKNKSTNNINNNNNRSRNISNNNNTNSSLTPQTHTTENNVNSNNTPLFRPAPSIAYTKTTKNTRNLYAATGKRTCLISAANTTHTKSNVNKLQRINFSNSVYISRCKNSTTPDDITKHIMTEIEGVNESDFAVRLLVKKDQNVELLSFVSFRILCFEKVHKHLTDPEFWPNGILIGDFHEKRKTLLGDFIPSDESTSLPANDNLTNPKNATNPLILTSNINQTSTAQPMGITT